jgi:hypothetical protein
MLGSGIAAKSDPELHGFQSVKIRDFFTREPGF